jgi:hypothetical protein
LEVLLLGVGVVGGVEPNGVLRVGLRGVTTSVAAAALLFVVALIGQFTVIVFEFDLF